MNPLIAQHLDALEDLCRAHHVKTLDLFGSAGGDRFDPDTSDIDLLVEFDPAVGPRRFTNYFALLDRLEKLLGRPVDLVEPGGVSNRHVRASIAASRQRLFDAAA